MLLFAFSSAVPDNAAIFSTIDPYIDHRHSEGSRRVSWGRERERVRKKEREMETDGKSERERERERWRQKGRVRERE